MIISGGFSNSMDNSDDTVEVYIPSTEQHCLLPDFPEQYNRYGRKVYRYHHTMEVMTVCGGKQTRTSCLTLIDGTWQTTTTLLEDR